jgi:hypothetical protein
MPKMTPCNCKHLLHTKELGAGFYFFRVNFPLSE